MLPPPSIWKHGFIGLAIPITAAAIVAAVVTVPLSMFFQRGSAKMSRQPGKADNRPEVIDSDAQWREKLTPEEYHVTREKGTERAFSGKYWNNKAKGIYRCVCCNTPLFDSNTKYESGTGWPSFYEPVGEDNVETETDNSHFMTRTEVMCRNCKAHLGHVFDDGPAQTGLRYCINSASLRFEESKESAE